VAKAVVSIWQIVVALIIAFELHLIPATVMTALLIDAKVSRLDHRNQIISYPLHNWEDVKFVSP
jgi:hypothetical protein